MSLPARSDIVARSTPNDDPDESAERNDSSSLGLLRDERSLCSPWMSGHGGSPSELLDGVAAEQLGLDLSS
jgi:hypothetical protein